MSTDIWFFFWIEDVSPNHNNTILIIRVNKVIIKSSAIHSGSLSTLSVSYLRSISWALKTFLYVNILDNFPQMSACDKFSSYAIWNGQIEGSLNSFSSKGVSRSPIALRFMFTCFVQTLGYGNVFFWCSCVGSTCFKNLNFFPSMKQLHDFKSKFES